MTSRLTPMEWGSIRCCRGEGRGGEGGEGMVLVTAARNWLSRWVVAYLLLDLVEVFSAFARSLLPLGGLFWETTQEQLGSMCVCVVHV